MRQTFFVGYLDKKAVYFVHFEVLELEYEVGLDIFILVQICIDKYGYGIVVYKKYSFLFWNKKLYFKGQNERERDANYAGPRSPGRSELEEVWHVEVGYV